MAATTLSFNGRTTSVPGSYTTVDASGLARPGLGASGIVALIGSAADGPPLVPQRISSSGKVPRIFRDGDLVEASQFVFDPSLDEEIPGGAQEIVFVRVDPATQAVLSLSSASGPALRLTSKGYGDFTNQLSAIVADGTNLGKKYTITDNISGASEVYDDVGGAGALSVQYVAGSNGPSAMALSFDQSAGLVAAFQKSEAGLGDYIGEFTTDGKDDEITAMGGAAKISVASSVAADTTQSITIVGLVSSTLTIETLLLSGTNSVETAATFTTFLGAYLNAGTSGNVTVTEVGAGAIAVIPAGQRARGAEIFSGNPMEVAGSPVLLRASGASTSVTVLVGVDADGVTTRAEAITLAGTSDVSSSGSFSQLDAVVTGAVANALSVIASGLLFQSGDSVRLISSAAGDTQAVILYGLDSDGAPQTETLTLTGTSAVTGTATWSELHGVRLASAAVGTITVSSSSHAIAFAAFTIAPAATSAGITALTNFVVGNTVLTLDETGNPAARNIGIFGLDSSGADAYEVVETVGAEITTTTNWSRIDGLCLSHLPVGRTMQLSGNALVMSVASYPTVQAVGSFIASKAGFSAVVAPGAGDQVMTGIDDLAPASILGTSVDLGGDLAAAIAAINSSSALVTAEAIAGGSGAPVNLAETYFAGGGTGIPTFADWQAAIDALRDEFVNTVVPLTGDEAVHAALLANTKALAGEQERDIILGTDSGLTLAQAKSRVQGLNSRHARLVIQDVQRFDRSGVRQWWPPYFTACLVAGMQAGSEVGVSLTRKYANVLDVRGNDDSYKVGEDANELIQAGLCMLRLDSGVGFYWLRNITTYLVDTNLAYIEASTNEATNFAVFNFRQRMIDLVGRKGFEGTINAAKGLAVGVLNDLVDQEVITNWQNLDLSLEADVLSVNVEIAPVVPVNFVASTIRLVSASFTAAA